MEIKLPLMPSSQAAPNVHPEDYPFSVRGPMRPEGTDPNLFL